jgi:hypothetical protein
VAAGTYVEALKELEEEYLTEKKQTFYEEHEDERDGVDVGGIEELQDKLAEEWGEQIPDERAAFAEMVKEAEAEAWRS